VTVLRSKRTPRVPAAQPSSRFEERELQAIEDSLEPDDYIGRALLGELRAGTTSSFEEVAATGWRGDGLADL
jgi:hypothetical protein